MSRKAAPGRVETRVVIETKAAKGPARERIDAALIAKSGRAAEDTQASANGVRRMAGRVGLAATLAAGGVPVGSCNPDAARGGETMNGARVSWGGEAEAAVGSDDRAMVEQTLVTTLLQHDSPDQVTADQVALNNDRGRREAVDIEQMDAVEALAGGTRQQVLALTFRVQRGVPQQLRATVAGEVYRVRFRVQGLTAVLGVGTPGGAVTTLREHTADEVDGLGDDGADRDDGTDADNGTATVNEFRGMPFDRLRLSGSAPAALRPAAVCEYTHAGAPGMVRVETDAECNVTTIVVHATGDREVVDAATDLAVQEGTCFEVNVVADEDAPSGTVDVRVSPVQ